MGYVRRLRKKYSTPMHPWIGPNIEKERELKEKYAFKNKVEYYKINSLLKDFKDRAKNLIAAQGQQAEKERKELLDRLRRLGLLEENARMEDILAIPIEKIMDRRLQTLLFKKGLARSIKQSRQFISHHHVSIAGKKITSPSYIVSKAEEEQVSFVPTSALSDFNHPERVVLEKKPKAEKRERPRERSDRRDMKRKPRKGERR